jgi:hypothetical protein
LDINIPLPTKHNLHLPHLNYFKTQTTKTFSKDKELHAILLKQFLEIVHHHDIMLSKSKMLIYKKKIEFLNMIFVDGAYNWLKIKIIF